MSNKDVNIYSFNDECYIYLGDYRKLQKENQQLKEENNITKEHHQEMFNYAYDLMLKRDKYKTVLDEIREYINKNSIYFATKEKVGNYFANCSCDELLQILDKVKKL